MLPENIQMFGNQMLGKFSFKRQVVPSRELTYPFPKALVKIMFLFPGGICLVLRRVSFFVFFETMLVLSSIVLDT